MIADEDRWLHIMKQIRVLRNISDSHKRLLNIIEIDYDQMTPYEVGRMTRASIRAGRELFEVMQEQPNNSIIWAVCYYLELARIKPGMFTKPGLSYWIDLQFYTANKVNERNIPVERMASATQIIREALDLPKGKVLGRLALIRLTLG